MNKPINKVVSVLIVVSLLFFLVCCTKNEPMTPIAPDEDRVLLSFRGETITESEFSYYLSMYKGRFAQSFSDFSDSEEFYSTDVNGMTMEEYLLITVVQNVMRTLVSEVLYAEAQLDDAELIEEDIAYYIDSIKYERYGNDAELFSEALAQFGITPVQLQQIYVRDEKTFSLFQHLAEEKTTVGLNDDAMQAYLEDNYSRIRHIYVNNKFTYELDENGRAVYDEDGIPKTAPLSGKALDAKNALISAIDASLSEGGDFDEIYDAFSEDKYYENGYYLTRNTDFIDEVVDAAFYLKTGEWKKLVTDLGTHYVMRLPLDNAPWENEDNSDFFGGFSDAVMNDLFADYLDSFADEVTVDDEVLKEFSIKDVKINTSF